MSLLTWLMLALFALAAAWILLRLVARTSVSYLLAPPGVFVRRPDGSFVRVALPVEEEGVDLDLEAILADAKLPRSFLPPVILPEEVLGSPLGRRLLGIAEEEGKETPRPRGLTLVRLRPWAAAVISIALLMMAVWVILRAGFSPDDKKSAWAVVSSVLGFWLGVGLSDSGTV